MSNRLPDQEAITAAPSHLVAILDDEVKNLTWAGLVALFATVYAAATHASRHKSGGADAIKLHELAAPDDNTTLDATTLLHGLMSKLDKVKLDAIEAQADVTDAGNVGAAVHGATAKTTPVDADTLALIDSAAGNVLKKVTVANLKTAILAALVDGAPETLDTLNELAAALADDASFAATMAAALGNKADHATTVTGGGLATGGGDLTAPRVITVLAASQAEAEAGTDNTKAMTPLRVAEAIAELAGGGDFESLTGDPWDNAPMAGLIGINVRAYGATGDARKVTDAVCANGDATVTSDSANFTAGDVGKIFWACDTGGTVVANSVIASINSGTSVELEDAATGSASGCIAVLGTDDTQAIIDANAAALEVSRAAVLVPAGGYIFKKRLFTHSFSDTTVPPAILGDGSERTLFFCSPDIADEGYGHSQSFFNVEGNCRSSLWRGFTIDGCSVLRDYIHYAANWAGNNCRRDDIYLHNWKAVIGGLYVGGAGQLVIGGSVRYIDSVGMQVAGGGVWVGSYLGDCTGAGVVVTNSGQFHCTGCSIDESSGGSMQLTSVTDARFDSCLIYAPYGGVALELITNGTCRINNTVIKPFGGNDNSTGLKVGSGCTAIVGMSQLTGSGTGKGLDNSGTVIDALGNAIGSRTGNAPVIMIDVDHTPTSDPEVPGQLWRDGDVLKVSLPTP